MEKRREVPGQQEEAGEGSKEIGVDPAWALHENRAATAEPIARPAAPGLIQRTDGTIALVDFDAARAINLQRTYGASLAGTFGYMPIEQLGGTVDATSDLHALGATLIHLLSGKPPQELLGPSLELRFAEHIQASAGFAAWLEGGSQDRSRAGRV